MTFLYPNVQVNYRVIFFLLMLMAAPALGAAGEITLSSGNSGLSRDGHVKLQWQGSHIPAGSLFEVQQAGTETFTDAKIIYRGPDLATFVSGLKNGNYYFRVRLGDNDWSNVVALTVDHHSLSLTFMLLGLGAIVFLLTAGIVIYGARKAPQIQ